MTKDYGVPMLVGEATAALAAGEALVPLDTATVRGRAGSVTLHTPEDLWPFDPATLPLQRQALAAPPPEAAALWQRIAGLDPRAAKYAALMQSRPAAAPGPPG
jgi:hypothetical protein